MHGTGTGSGVTAYVIIIVFQVLLCIAFSVLTKYDTALLPEFDVDEHENKSVNANHGEEKGHVPSYPHFQDIHVMIFIGFAFLMTFLRKYGYGATGFNYLLGALLIQWAMIMRGVYELEDGKIHLSLDSMIGADIAVASVLISMGALLGRTTPIQLLWMGIIEIAVFSANEYFQLEHLKIADAGGSIVVHSFGAYFGLAVSFMMRPKKGENVAGPEEGPTYTSDLFAMLGSIFLWIYWPSFNSALVDGPDQNRAVLNTYLSLGAATVTTFVLSILVSHEKKFDMVHIQNSTLAGGVAVGSICNMMIQPHGAILIGIVAGLTSVIGYKYLTPLIFEKLRLSDTCGVHNLHGMPAVVSAVASAIYAALATKATYGKSLYNIFPGMKEDMANTIMSINNTIVNATDPEFLNSNGTNHISGFGKGFMSAAGRSAEVQGGYQLLGILSTLVIAIVAGMITGLFINSPSFKRMPKDKIHMDDEYWEVPETFLN